MRILHVIPQFAYFGARTIIGGYSSAVLELSLAQAAVGHEVTVLGYVPAESGRGRIEEGVDVISIFEDADPGSTSFGLKFLRAAPKWVREHAHRFDVVHNHSGFADYLLVGGAIARKTPLPVAHTMYCPIPHRGGRWNLPWVPGVLRRGARRMNVITAMSQNVATSMEQFGLGPVVAVPPAVDLERFAPHAPDAARERLGLPRDGTIMLFVGNAKPQKNLTRTLDAFAAVLQDHPDTHLVVTTELPTSSSDARLETLAHQIQTLDIGDHMTQLGIIDDMPDLMTSCDVLIAPFIDSLGPSDYFVAVLEAMASGRPTVVSSVGGMPEVVESSWGRLIDPQNTSEIAQAMGEYVADEDLRKRSGALARAFCEATFKPASVAATWNGIYEEIIG